MADLIGDRRRAVVLWVGDHERAGADFRLKDIYADLVDDGGLFPDDTVLLDTIRDLDDRTGSGHLRQVADLAMGTLHPIALTERGREWYPQLRASRVRRLGGRVGGSARWVLAAVVLALIGAATQWLFDWLPRPAQ
jgi:hypothetical protein